MKNRNHRTLIAGLALIAVELLASCTPKGSSHRPVTKDARPQATSSPAESGSPSRASNLGNGNSTAPGTSDSGGGNGLDGKVFEAFAVDPLKLPAYVNHVKPWLDKIRPTDTETRFSYHDFLKTKTWYIVPADLSVISKDVLGVSFLRNQTDQLALQRKREVWISKRFWDTMSERDQGVLILHELVMMVYLMKFEPFSELCKMSTLIAGEASTRECREQALELDRAMPPEPRRRLNDADYQSIRFVTAWIVRNSGAPIEENKLVELFFAKGFDRRLFNPSSFIDPAKPSQNFSLSFQSLVDAFTSAQAAGDLPTVCTRTSDSESKPCQVSVTRTSATFEGQTLNALSLTVSAENETPVTLLSAHGSDVSLSDVQAVDGSTTYILPVVDIRAGSQVGTRVASGFLMFTRDNGAPSAPLILDRIVLKAGIIASVDRNRDPVCQMRRPRNERFFDDTIVIRRAGSAPASTEGAFIVAPPLGFCP